MTGDELERAIDFILKSQAGAEARIQRNEEQLAQQGADFQKRLDSIATAHASLEEAHADLVRVLKQHLETQELINKSLRETDVRQARFSALLGEMLRASEESRRASEESRRVSEESLRETLRTSEESLRAAMTKLATRQERTEATVDRLSQKVEALVKIVGEERNGGR